MKILAKLLGGANRIKIMRLFLLNKDDVFEIKDISKRALIKKDLTKKEISLLKNISFIRRKGKGYTFDYNFKYKKEFEDILINPDVLNKEEIVSMFKKVGKVKLLIVSGVFIKNKDSRVDLLLVGDKLKKNKIEENIKKIEAELGTQTTYVVFDSEEFLYRLDMYDKLVRDVLDFPHKILFQSKEFPTQLLKKF